MLYTLPVDAPTLFNPPREAIPAILADLRRPDVSFTDLAKLHNTTPDALSLWLTTPAIAAQLESTDSVVCYRARLIAADKISIGIQACVAILDRFNAKHAGPPRTAPDETDALHQLRECETARKAATTLLRLTRLAPTPRPGWEPKAKASPAAAPHPKSDVSQSRVHANPELTSLAAAIQHAATINPSRDPIEVLEELCKEEEAPPQPARREPQPARAPNARPLPFGSKQLWRKNIPGAALARAP